MNLKSRLFRFNLLDLLIHGVLIYKTIDLALAERFGATGYILLLILWQFISYYLRKGSGHSGSIMEVYKVLRNIFLIAVVCLLGISAIFMPYTLVIILMYSMYLLAAYMLLTAVFISGIFMSLIKPGKL